jgi:3-methyl-2-oxobutanoate hydroxymethyltransferase
MKGKSERITMVTAYDYPMAALADRAGIDIILVGDSVGTVVLGYKSTVPVTLEEIIHHSKAVVRGASRAMVIGDMPYLSYQVSVEEAMRNAGRLVKETGVHAVKIEGGREMADVVKAVVEKMGIPVMGHIGLTPQRASISGGYKLQGKDAESARRIIEDALALEKAGAFAVLLEFITAEVAKIITEKLSVPTIGIGSGPHCDGQVLVIHDLLGFYESSPKFAKRYADLNKTISDALQAYIKDIRLCKFPAEEHTFHMDKEEYEKLMGLLGGKI